MYELHISASAGELRCGGRDFEEWIIKSANGVISLLAINDILQGDALQILNDQVI